MLDCGHLLQACSLGYASSRAFGRLAAVRHSLGWRGQASAPLAGRFHYAKSGPRHTTLTSNGHPKIAL